MLAFSTQRQKYIGLFGLLGVGCIKKCLQNLVRISPGSKSDQKARDSVWMVYITLVPQTVPSMYLLTKMQITLEKKNKSKAFCKIFVIYFFQQRKKLRLRERKLIAEAPRDGSQQRFRNHLF